MEEPQEELSAAQLKETKSNLQADAESTSSDVSPSAGDDVEAKLASYFPEFGKGGVPSLEQFRYAESDIQEISKLLRNMGNIPWSCVPRLYIVLRTAGQLPLLDALIADEVTDTWFPFPAWMLPDSWDTLQRQHFARTQLIVLTKMTDLENGDFMDHKHLDEDAAAQLQTFDVLGTGWFAKVDKVQIPSHQDTFYARKSIYRRSSRKDSRNDLKYFENELKVLKSLVHHHIVKLIGSYTEPKFLGLILSPVAGCDLKAFLSQDSLSDSQRTLLRSFFGCLSAGLAYLHMQRVVHGDITPANILIHGENVLICGFLSSNDWSGEADSVTSGPWPRTPRYAALEVYDNECRGDFSDIWSLGCVFLVMLTRLRGKSLDVFAKIFAESGSKPKTFCANLEAIAFLLEVLEEADGPIYDNIPIRWIQEMLQEDHNCRPTAPELQKMILETGADTVPRNIFCGSCCAQIQSDRMGDSFQEEPAGVEASFIRDWDRIATNVSEICAGIPGSFERGSQGQQDELYLPQIVACGDQSSGKSSVLDAITGLTFPKNLVTCTRFATEVRVSSHSTISVSARLYPADSENAVENVKIEHFNESSHLDIEHSVQEAANALGLTEARLKTDLAHRSDVLRISAQGPLYQNVKVVDIPGLFHWYPTQGSSQDVDTVHGISRQYMDDHRSIILAVFNASNSRRSQRILDWVKKADPDGKRSICILNKPDTVRGEARLDWINTVLKYKNSRRPRQRWHVLLNRNHVETRNNTSSLDRDRQEEGFFKDESTPWHALYRTDQWGVAHLRKHLHNLLLQYYQELVEKSEETKKSTAISKEKKPLTLDDREKDDRLAEVDILSIDNAKAEAASELQLPKHMTSLSLYDVQIIGRIQLSWSDHFKAFAERYSGEAWNWWPLSPRSLPLSPGNVRIQWACRCGQKCWADVSEESVSKYLDFLRRNPMSRNNAKEAVIEDDRQVPDEATLVPNRLNPTDPSLSEFGETRSEILAASQGTNSNPPTPTLTSLGNSSSASNSSTTPTAAATQAPKSPSVPNTNQNPTAASAPGPSRTRSNSPNPQNLYILFCVYRGRTLRHTEIDVSKRNDDQFFDELRSKYKNMRGWFRYYFDPRQFDHCDFVKFTRFYVHELARICHELPHDSEYHYQPRPPAQHDDPPIVPHEFYRRFYHVKTCLPLPQNEALSRIPKRRKHFQVDLHVGGREDMWGLHAEIRPFFWMVAAWMLIILVGGFVFWGWWMSRHPGDWQNASVPFTAVLGCMMMLLLPLNERFKSPS